MTLSYPRFAVVVLAVSLLSVGCGRETDVSSQSPYSEKIGKTFRVIGDVNAYVTKADLSDKEPSYVTIRPVGLSGPEYVGTVRIPKDTTFRVVAARRKFMLLDDGTRYLVEISIPDIPKGLEVGVPLLDSDRSEAGLPSTDLFEQLPG